MYVSLSRRVIVKNWTWDQAKIIIVGAALALFATGCRANLGNLFDLF
jgi:hypothetical protein